MPTMARRLSLTGLLTCLVLSVAAMVLPAVSGLAVTHAATTTCPAPGGTGVAEAAAPSAEVVFAGHGLGHNLGMSQYGAQGAAKLGCTYQQILAGYYNGTTLATRPSPAEIRLWMLKDGTRVDVTAETGSLSWSVGSCDPTACPPAQPQGAKWQLRANAAKTEFELLDATGTVVWHGPATNQVSLPLNGTAVALTSYVGSTKYLSRRVRWDTLRFTLDSAGVDGVLSLRAGAVPALGTTLSAMDKYLWGLGEVPLSWTRQSHEALKTQVVAARSYAMNTLANGTSILYATTAHQYYSGYDKEVEDASYADQLGRTYRWADAVRSTSDQVVVNARGAVISAFYTSSHGGFSEDLRYVWGGTTALSYLRAVDDSTWDRASSNPYRAWARGFSLAEVAQKLGFERVDTISVPNRSDPARVQGVTVTGVLGGVTVTKRLAGDTVRRKLALPSNGFLVTVAVAAAPVTAPAPAPAVSATPTPSVSATPTPTPTPTLSPSRSTTPVPTATPSQPSAPKPPVVTTPTPKLPVGTVTPKPVAPRKLVPSQPRTVRSLPGGRSKRLTAIVSWKTPASRGSGPILGYYVRVVRLSRTGKVVSITSSPLLPAGARSYEPRLRAGTYYFQVRAANAVGRSPLSAPSARVPAR